MTPPIRGPANPPQEDPLDMRLAPRVGTDLPVEIYSSEFSGPLPGRTRDLSVGGACIATASPFSAKCVHRINLMLPNRNLTRRAEGRWQRESPADDLVLTGVGFDDPGPDELDALWWVVTSSGQQLARFLHERSSLQELGLEEAMGLAQCTRYKDIPIGPPSS